jgi:hypothetical protein
VERSPQDADALGIERLNDVTDLKSSPFGGRIGRDKANHAFAILRITGHTHQQEKPNGKPSRVPSGIAKCKDA